MMPRIKVKAAQCRCEKGVQGFGKGSKLSVKALYEKTGATFCYGQFHASDCTMAILYSLPSNLASPPSLSVQHNVHHSGLTKRRWGTRKCSFNIIQRASSI